MKKSITTKTIDVQRRFFAALDTLIALKRITGIKGFCEKYGLNRVKYTRLKNDLGKPIEDMFYKSIDVEALADICELGISPEWLLLGHGKMLTK